MGHSAEGLAYEQLERYSGLATVTYRQSASHGAVCADALICKQRTTFLVPVPIPRFAVHTSVKICNCCWSAFLLASFAPQLVPASDFTISRPLQTARFCAKGDSRSATHVETTETVGCDPL